MLKINAIKIDIVTADGNYGFEQSLTTGLNIIRGNNSSGKSSLFQAIFLPIIRYCHSLHDRPQPQRPVLYCNP